MRVEQQNQILEALQQSVGTDGKNNTVISQNKAETAHSVSGESVSVQMQNATYLNPAKEDKKTIADELEKNSEMDSLDRKNQMAVLSNTTSEEDYAKIQEDGFSLESTESRTIVTETDKIKMQLAKAGKDISCFGDGLDAAQLEELAGSAALATQLEQTLKQADLPATEENMELSVEALSQAAALTDLGDGAIKYIMDNELEPTIENIYKAEFSGSANYTLPAENQSDMMGMENQIQSVIVSAGMEVTEDTMKDSKWLIENQIPLTKENLEYYEALKNLELPISEQQTMEQIAEAITDGKAPKDAMLMEGYSLSDQAQHTMDVINNATEEDLAYIINQGQELTVENLAQAANNRGKIVENQNASKTSDSSSTETVMNENTDTTSAYTEKGLALLTAQRQLEEVRLAMTSAANYALLKQGISIDTEPLVKLVDALKNQENQYYANLLQAQGAEASEANVALFAETTEKIQELQQVPAYVLGMKDADISTINQAYEAGTQLKADMEKASQSYETLMTAPRADMGDSIQKAFQNVDTILEDLGMDTSEANQRAVRILGYNNIEITEESILEMKAADEEVQRVFKNMSPAVVTEMIKRGINPLEMDFAALNQAAEEIKSEVGKDENQKFSEYLYKLEKNNEITEEERSTYIGVYRLITQVEKTDGAAVGALVNQGAELSLKNLMTAVRTGKKSHMDYSVDDNFGESEKSGTYSNSITEQINAAYQNNCLKDAMDELSPGKLKQVMEQNPDWENMTPEQFAQALAQAENTDASAESSYLQEQMTMMEKAAGSSEEIYQILQQFDLPNTMMNVMALNSMLSNRNQLFRQIFGDGTTEKDDKVTIDDLEAIKEDLIEEFGEAISEPEALAEVQEALGEVAENVMKTMIDSENVTSIDIREMRLMQAKLSMNSLFAKDEQYSVPVLVGDKVTNVSLKIVRGVDTKGIVDIMLESEMAGKIAATFQAKEEGISGLVVSDNQKARDLFADHMGMLAAAIQEDGGEQLDLRFAVEKNLDLNHFSGVAASKTEAASEKNILNRAGENTASKESNENIIAEESGENSVYKVQTARLYHIAEAFIKTMKEFA